MDSTDFSLAHWNADTRRIVAKATETSQDHYPDGMGRMFIVNAPWIFRAVWPIAKAWMDERMKSKISLEGVNFMA